MASRNGLNPKIRGSKGVGFGRELPSAFGFGNGIRPNPNRYEYITIPGLIGQALPHQMTFELWINHDEEFTTNEGWLQYNIIIQPAPEKGMELRYVHKYITISFSCWGKQQGNI
ncbi:MAG: hypothetical protein ACHQF4_11995 [Sphingobacteriales bacterium]